MQWIGSNDVNQDLSLRETADTAKHVSAPPAISTMCGGQGCAQSQETRQYNSRLQPVLMELGNSSNLTADYCLVYNYYTGVTNPTGCAMPSQGSGDNGNVVGKYYQDNTDPSYSQAAGYTYDGVNRLMTAVATGNSPFSLTYSYDQYGNGTCVMNGSTQGFCPQYSYNQANNHITNTGYNYDPAGDLLWDGGSNYEYDAEGRVKHSYSTGQWQYPMYNALGQRVQDYQGIDPMTLTYPIDIFGQRTGTFAQWPSQGWTGWNVYWAQVAGQHISMGGADSWLAHSDAIGSTTMLTDETGAVVYEAGFDPWGRLVQSGGPRPWFSFAGLQFPVNDPSYPSNTREYNDGLGRWLTPDPGGVKVVKLDDPQTWNMYAYVTDNPTSLNDPGGLQSGCAANVNITGPVGGHCSPNDELVEEATANGSDAREGAQGQSWWKRSLSIFYVKRGNGAGFGLKVDVGVDVHVLEKRGQETTSTMEGSTTSKVNELKATVKVLNMELGMARGTSQVISRNESPVNEPPKPENVFIFSHGKFEGSNAQLGVGVGGCFGVCGEISGGIQLDKAWDNAKNLFNQLSDEIESEISD